MRSWIQLLKLMIGVVGFLLLTAMSGLAQGHTTGSVGLAPSLDRKTSPQPMADQGLPALAGYRAFANRATPSPARPVRFSTDDPGTILPFGDTLAQYFFAGGILLDGKAYAVQYGGNKLFVVDTTTGSITEVGPMVPIVGESWTGMAWDPVTHTAFASSEKSLYSANLSTGVVSQVGSYGFSSDLMICIAVTAAGQMYGIGIASDTLFRIDKTTGGTIPVGPIGFNANYAQDMAFERSSGTLYYAAYNLAGGGELRTVDIVTGATTLIGPFPSGHQIDALMFSESTGEVSGKPQYYNLNTGTSSNSYPFNVTGGKAVNSLFLPGNSVSQHHFPPVRQSPRSISAPHQPGHVRILTFLS